MSSPPPRPAQNNIKVDDVEKFQLRHAFLIRHPARRLHLLATAIALRTRLYISATVGGRAAGLAHAGTASASHRIVCRKPPIYCNPIATLNLRPLMYCKPIATLVLPIYGHARLQVIAQQCLRMQARRSVRPLRQLEAEVHELLLQPRLLPALPARHLFRPVEPRWTEASSRSQPFKVLVVTTAPAAASPLPHLPHVNLRSSRAL